MEVLPQCAGEVGFSSCVPHSWGQPATPSPLPFSPWERSPGTAQPSLCPHGGEATLEKFFLPSPPCANLYFFFPNDMLESPLGKSRLQQILFRCWVFAQVSTLQVFPGPAKRVWGRFAGSGGPTVLTDVCLTITSCMGKQDSSWVP